MQYYYSIIIRCALFFRNLSLFHVLCWSYIQFLFLLFFSNSQFTQFFITKIEADWGSSDSNQYHIQTDEGPERFFRYQTDSGQFRNEKRLKDGTVIGNYYDMCKNLSERRNCQFPLKIVSIFHSMKCSGTEAWIDASGYLRQKDYIADKDGYRILKSKTIFVGQSRPIKVSNHLFYTTSTEPEANSKFAHNSFTTTQNIFSLHFSRTLLRMGE